MEQLAAFQAILRGVGGRLKPVIAVLGKRNDLQHT